MPHIFESALSGRSKCRGCRRAIARGDLRFGERLPSPFAEGEMTLWFHPVCAAYKRPAPFLEGLSETHETLADRAALESIAQRSLLQRRLPRIDGAEPSPSGQAKCRSCHQPIERGAWRIRLVFFEDGMFTPGGFIHLNCRQAYFEAHDVMEQVLHFSPDLNENELTALKQAFRS